jgi:hypothetical protein
VTSQSERILSIDLEDYFQVEMMTGVVPVRYWPRLERRLDEAVHAWLDGLAQSNSSATFFASPWVVKMHPTLVTSVSAAGHEIAALGLFESPQSSLEPRAFATSVADLKSSLEQLTGRAVVGFRLARGIPTHEQLQSLRDAGFTYDSSRRSHHVRMPGEIRHVTPQFGSEVGREPGSRVGSRREAHIFTWFRRDTNVDEQSDIAIRYPASVLDPAQPRITALTRSQQRQHYREIFLRATQLSEQLARQPSVSIADALSLVLAPVQVHATALIQPLAMARADVTPREQITLVVPCCNEELSIAYLANTLARFETGAAAGYAVNYVFVDDGSTDETHTKLRQYFGQNPRAQIVRHEINKGVAAATMTGLWHASTELVGVIDCDCSYDPAEVVRMIPLMQNGTALVTASPYHPDGHVVNVPAWRLWLSRRLSQLYRITLNTPLYTYTACVRLYRKSALQDLTLRHGNYLGIAEILARLDQSGARIVESPATLEARILGHSKMKIVRTSIGHIGLLAELTMARILLRTKKQLGFAS